MLPRFRKLLSRPLAKLLLATALPLLLTACAVSPMTTGSIGSTQSPAGSPDQARGALMQLQARYKKSPGDRAVVLSYAAALRSNGQAEQAVAVLEGAVGRFKGDPTISVEYAKALSAAGRFDQALNVVDGAIDPTAPDWNALLVKGAILDQSNRGEEARQIYQTALKIAPNEPSLHANLGLSYALTNDLGKAEAELRIAVSLPGAPTQVRQNLALVVGLQGRFDEAQKLFEAELPPTQVEANMAYVRSLLTQPNRWDLVKKSG